MIPVPGTEHRGASQWTLRHNINDCSVSCQSLYFTESLLLEDIAGGGPVTALRLLLWPEGRSEGERATDHSVLARLTADPLDRDVLGQAVESVPGQVGAGALAVLVLLLVREGDDQEVGPERGSGGETLLGHSWPLLSLSPTEAAVAEEDKCDEE